MHGRGRGDEGDIRRYGIDADIGGLEKTMRLDVMREFKCKAVSSALSNCDDRREKQHKAWRKNGRLSQVDHILRPKTGTCASYKHNEVTS